MWYNAILAREFGCGDVTELGLLLEEVSKLLDAFGILTPEF